MNETRRQLKAKFITARDRLVGKQLTTLNAYEKIFKFCDESYLGWNEGLINNETAEGERMRDLHKIIKDLKMHLREDVPESGTNEDILDDFRNAIGNHLVAEMDPYDLE